MTVNGGPTAKQLKLINSLLEHNTQGAALAAAGVSETTLRRWRTEPVFVAALEDAQRELFAGGYARLLVYQNDVLDELHRLATMSRNDSVRVRAAVALEAALVKRYELATLGDLEARLAALEAQP